MQSRELNQIGTEFNVSLAYVQGVEHHCTNMYTTLGHGYWSIIIIRRRMHRDTPFQAGGDSKYDSIERNQDMIGMLISVKGVMFNFDGNK